MNIERTVNTASAMLLTVLVPASAALSLPLCLSLSDDDAPSLSLPPYVPDGVEGQMLPAFVEGEGTTLLYPSQLPPCDHEDGTSTSQGIDVPACIWDASLGNGSGTTFIVIANNER